MKYFLSLIASVLCIASLQAQLAFEKTERVLLGESYFSGVAMAVTDLNGDLLDDVVHLDRGMVPYLRFQTNDGNFRKVERLQNVSSNGSWSVVAGDINNNGRMEIISAPGFQSVKLISADPLFREFDRSNLGFTPFLPQAMNLVDMNNDGWLDVFICNDDGPSKIALNDQTGGFTINNDFIDFTTDPPSNMSGNYGSIWSDFDLDGDQDLYIAKCRQGVDDPSDPRRINVLYVNDGNGNFTELADSFGVASSAQSWVGSFGDIDNDGDMDLVIGNHYAEAELLINDSLQFTDEAAGRGLQVQGFPIQAVMADFDNDGFLDIFISGSDHNFFLNDGSGSFSRVDGLFDENQIESVAVGDLNNDGFLDVYAGYANVINTPGSIPDAVFLNSGNENNYVRFKLRGRANNRMGIGARLELYSALGMQIREQRAGESYGICNSASLHFGLGQDEVIDSLVVVWPDGQRQKFEQIPANHYYILDENGCLTTPLVTEPASEQDLCKKDSLLLSVDPAVAGDIIWNTGDSSRQLLIDSAGLYFYRASDSAGCNLYSFPNYVNDSLAEKPEYSLSDDPLLCRGASIVLQAEPLPSYLWSTGDTTRAIEIDEQGIYYLQTSNDCGTFISDTTVLELLDRPVQAVFGDTVLTEGRDTLVARGDSILWYESADAADPVAVGDTFVTPQIDTSTLYFAANLATSPGLEASGGEFEHEGNTFFSSDLINASMYFDITEETVIREFTVFTDRIGRRVFLLLDQMGNTLWSDTVTLVNGGNNIVVDVQLPPAGNYELTTDEEFNQAELGHPAPRLYRTQNSTNYPYLIANNMQITTSEYGTEYYYYFYNIHIQDPDLVCISERVPVLAVVRNPDATDRFPSPDSYGIEIYPNPTGSHWNIRFEQPEKWDNARLMLFDLTGKLIISRETENLGNGKLTIAAEELNNGLYLLKLEKGKQLAWIKLIKN